MKKWLTRCALAAALIGIVLPVVVSQSHPPGIWTGKPLPPGKVKPQLANAWLCGVLLAPDGSLWVWGGSIRKYFAGSVWTLGRSMFPQAAISQVPRRIGSDSDWTQVAAGMETTLALKNDGSLWVWGKTNFGKIGQPVPASYFGTPTRIGSETNWSQISTSSAHNLALKNDGSLWGWGENGEGELGDGTTNNSSVPTMIGMDRNWRAIAADDQCSFALKSNGTIWGCGLIGYGTNLVPRQIGSGTNWSSISHGFDTLIALKTDGTLWVKGPHVSSMTGDFNHAPTGDFTQIGRDRDWTEAYAGAGSFFARKKDGSWWGCGWNHEGQLGFGTTGHSLHPPRLIPFHFDPWAFAPGVRTTFLLGKDGKLWTWGERLGVEKSSAARQEFEDLIAPAVNRFPSLGFLIKSDIDRTPRLLWELPPEMRRSLGTEPKSSTNNFTN
jgi:alpha-tubulin suppressor-like RCC1 family protein